MKELAEKRILLSSILSGVFEYYDFIIFVVMAKILTEIFLNNNDAISYTIMVSSGFFARFFGGIIFGYLADKIGINKTFSLTLLLMLLSCILISIIPSYNQVGYFSIIFLFSIRMIQGASLGGEIPISVVFSLENCKKIKNYFISSSLFFGFTIGTLLAYATINILNRIFTIQQIHSFAWRIPFLLGCMLMFISIFIRKNILNNKNNLFILKNTTAVKLGIKNIMQGFLIVSVPTLIYNMAYFQSPIYLSKKYSINNDAFKPYIIEGVILTGLLSVLLSILFKNYNKIYKIGLWISVFITPVLIHFILSGNESYVHNSLVLFSIPESMMFSGLYCILFAQFENKAKVLSIAICINLANVIFSSSAYFMLYLFDNYFSMVSIVTAIFCFLVIYFSKNLLENKLSVK